MPLVRLTDDEEPTPNLAPMIDVILVLTIFFMCATKFSADERAFDLDLPAADHAAAGKLRLGTEPVSLDDLGQRLTARREALPDLVVMIRGERDVSHGRMTEVYEACRGAGVRHVAISVRGRAAR
jgi:biopolymer transport protein ExbD